MKLPIPVDGNSQSQLGTGGLSLEQTNNVLNVEPFFQKVTFMLWNRFSVYGLCTFFSVTMETHNIFEGSPQDLARAMNLIPKT